jgi:hypothetical protein
MGGSDSDDDDETLPSREGSYQVNHKKPKGNFYRVTAHLGLGGSFDRAGTPQELSTTSIDPTLVFEFNYKLDMNGIIYDKQIHITTSLSQDICVVPQGLLKLGLEDLARKIYTSVKSLGLHTNLDVENLLTP